MFHFEFYIVRRGSTKELVNSNFTSLVTLFLQFEIGLFKVKLQSFNIGANTIVQFEYVSENSVVCSRICIFIMEFSSVVPKNQ